MNIKTMSDEIYLPMYEGKQQTTATEMVHIFGGSHSMSVRTFAAISDEDKKPKLKHRQIYYTRCAYHHSSDHHAFEPLHSIDKYPPPPQHAVSNASATQSTMEITAQKCVLFEMFLCDLITEPSSTTQIQTTSTINTYAGLSVNECTAWKMTARTRNNHTH
eukprot:206285_1